MAGTRVGIYARISRNPDGTRDGTDRQVANIEEEAAHRGWTVVALYVDEDISASSARVKRRPRYEQMLADLRAGHLDLVVAQRLDRLMRRPAEWEPFWAACQAGGANVHTLDNIVVTNGAMGQAVIQILLVIAKLETDLISARLRDKYRHSALAGKAPPGGVRPFGYELHYAGVREPEAELIRDAAKRILAGQSLRSIQIEWHERGVVTPTGKPWSNTPMIRMLKASGLAGHRVHRGAVVARDAWPAILDQDTHERLVAALTARGDSARGKSRLRSFLLSGLVVCSLCGYRMVSSRDHRGARRYVCRKPPGCARQSIQADPLESYVTRAVLRVLADPGLRSALEAKGKRDRPSVDMESLHRDRQKLIEIAEMWADGSMSRAELFAARSIVSVRVEDAERRLAQAAAPSAAELPSSEAALSAAWDARDINWRHSIVRLVLGSIDIGPPRLGAPRTFSAFDRVVLNWIA